MTRETIEARIRFVEGQMAVETDPSTLATLNRCMERLIFMEADDEKEEPCPKN